MMENFDCNKPNVTFGIAFKTYKNKNGVVTGDLLDFKQELKMYKTLENKLKNDTFEKINKGLKSKDTKIEIADYNPHKTIRYTDNTGSYFMADDGTKLRGLSDAFKSVRKTIDNILGK